jgi:uncharacterized protein
MDRMRRLLLPSLAAATLTLVVAALAGVGRPEAARGDTGTPDTVTTVGHGVVTVAPDRATVSAGVHTQAATAAAALAENARRMNAVVAALKAAAGEDLQTQEVSLYPQSDDKGTVTGYVADDSVSAGIAIAKAGALVDAAVAAGANTVNGPSLSVSDEDARYREALGKAVSDARAKAQALADAGGFGVGPVSVVAEQSDTPQPVWERAAVGAAAKDAPTPVEAGSQEITADVTVTFHIR